MIRQRQEISVIAGLRSKEALEAKLRGAAVLCEVKGRDLYGRNVSRCSVDGKADIGQWLVSNGYAIAYRSEHLQQCAQGRPELASALLLRMFIKIPIAAMLFPEFRASRMLANVLLAS